MSIKIFITGRWDYWWKYIPYNKTGEFDHSATKNDGQGDKAQNSNEQAPQSSSPVITLRVYRVVKFSSDMESNNGKNWENEVIEVKKSFLTCQPCCGELDVFDFIHFFTMSGIVGENFGKMCYLNFAINLEEFFYLEKVPVLLFQHFLEFLQ